jgi:hypothetical protein
LVNLYVLDELNLYSWRGYLQIEVRECLLSFGAESFVFQFYVPKIVDYDTQNYNFVCCFVWYGCETWSLAMREQRGLRLLENRLLRKIFWPMRDEVTGEWRKLLNEEFNECNSRPILIW